ncbi:MAG: hypothetical protein RBR67_20745 [Desulfobacterium sp.]|jgi:hypothetical protein|nr:hypothetical protein [Desulfobacterium sp.]
MLSPGMLIALDVTILYLTMGPLVLYALYVIFDSLGQKKEVKSAPLNTMAMAKTALKDPALWSDEDFIL